MNKDLLAASGTLLVILFVVGLFYGAQYIPTSWWTGVSYYDQTNGNSCHAVVTENSIVLRIDDVTDNSLPSQEMILEILRRGHSVTLGVIPDRLSNQHKYHDFLVQTAANPLVEIAVHGSNHSSSDINISEAELVRGWEKTVSLLGVAPVTYIPPYNQVTPEAYELISKHYKVLSRTGAGFNSGHGAAEVSQTVETYDYETVNHLHGGPTAIDTIIDSCSAALRRNRVCVVTFHPQELSTNITRAVDVNASKKLHFMATLDALETLNATFVTLKDTTRCSE